MSQFRSVLRVCIAVLVGAAIFGESNQAKAAFAVRYSIDGGDFTVVNGTSSITTDIVDLIAADYVLTVHGTTSGSTLQRLLDLEVHGFVGDHTIVIEASVTGVGVPAPQLLTTQFTGTGPVTAQTWVVANGADAALFSTGLTAGELEPNNNNSLSFSDPDTYTLTTRITITGTGEVLAVTGDVDNKVIQTPAPGGLVLALGAVPFLALGGRLRRRLARTA